MSSVSAKRVDISYLVPPAATKIRIFVELGATSASITVRAVGSVAPIATEETYGKITVSMESSQSIVIEAPYGVQIVAIEAKLRAHTGSC
jgi:hypothetical protein